MTEAELVRELSRPEAWGLRRGKVEVIHTHASIVFLLDHDVYKIKRAVNLGFLDYSTLEKRRKMCEAEVAIDSRTAPGVYLGVVALRKSADGLTIHGDGEIVEHAVHMRRLPDEASLSARVVDDRIDDDLVRRVARRIAHMHAAARRSSEISATAVLERVVANARENFDALRAAPDWVDRNLLRRIETATIRAFEEHGPLIAERAERDVPCEGHGDLRLEHVYVLPPDDRLAIIDGVEFSLGYRASDPVSDLAFLAMDFQAHGAWWAAEALWREYFEATGDDDGRDLVPLYVAYRSLVRAKVRAMQAGLAATASVSESARRHAAELAGAHVRVAAAALLEPIDRPSLVLVGGLPGTGKSVLAHGLERYGYTWIRADAVRKELAGLDPTSSAHTDVRAGIYTPQWNDRTYDACASRAADVLARGGRVVVDASFKENGRRRAFVDLATRLGVHYDLLICVATPEAIRGRLDARHGDPSDADWAIYEHVRATWEPLGPKCRRAMHTIDTSGTPEDSLQAAASALGLV